MKRLTPTPFGGVMALCFFSRSFAFLVPPHKDDVIVLLPEGSTLTRKRYICPFLYTIALVKPLICECLSIVFSTCHFLSLVDLLTTIAPACLPAMSRSLFRFVQSSSRLPRAYLPNTPIFINPKQGIPNERC